MARSIALLADGRAEVYFDPPDKYIWSLAVMPDGALAIGTGDSGKLYRVQAAGAKPESSLLISTNQTHVMSLIVSKQGDLIAGTDPGGLVLRISPEEKPLLSSTLRCARFMRWRPAADGSIYALALSEAASTTRSPAKSGHHYDDSRGSGTATATVPPKKPALRRRRKHRRGVAMISRVRAASFSYSAGRRHGCSVEFNFGDRVCCGRRAAGRSSDRHLRKGTHLFRH